MKKVNSWYEFNYVSEHIDNLADVEYDGEIGNIIKKIVEIYGIVLPELYERYGLDIFIIAYSNQENLIKDNENLEKKLISDFSKKLNEAREQYKGSCSLRTFKMAVINGEEFFDENEVKLVKKYPDEILELMYSTYSLRFQANLYSKQFIEILKNVEFEDYKFFLDRELRISSNSYIENLLKIDSEFDVNFLIPILRETSSFYSNICDKYIMDSSKLESNIERAKLLNEYFKQYTSSGNDPDIYKYNLEKFIDFPYESVLKQCKPNSAEYNLVNLYKENLSILVEKYGFDLFSKVYLSKPIERSNDKIATEEDFLEDVKAKIKEGSLNIEYENYNKLYKIAGDKFVSQNEKKLFEKYPDEILKLMFSNYKAKFEVPMYNDDNLVRILQGIEFDDYKNFLNIKECDFLKLGNLLKKYPELDVDKIMPILNEHNSFYEDLYNKVVNENPNISESELKGKIRAEFISWHIKNGRGLPRIARLEDLEEFYYLSSNTVNSCVSFYNSDDKKIYDYYGKNFLDLVKKYGSNIFKMYYYQTERLLLNDDILEDNDYEKKLLNDYNYFLRKRNIIYLGGCYISFDTLKRIYEKAPEGFLADEYVKMFQKFPGDVLKKIYSNGKFEIKDDNMEIAVEAFSKMKYEAINFLDGSWWNSSIKELLEKVLDEKTLQEWKSKEYSKLSGRDLLLVLYDLENIDKIVDSLDKLGNPELFRLIIDSNEKKTYEIVNFLYNRYGKYIKDIDIEELISNNEKIESIQQIEQIVKKGIAISIKNRKIKKYGDDFPEEFIKENPELFLDKDIPNEIRQKFYNRELEYSDFELDENKNEDLWNLLKDKHLYLGFKEDFSYLSDEYKNKINIIDINKKLLEVTKRLDELDNDQMSTETKEVFRTWVKENISSDVTNIQEFSKKVRFVYVLINHIILSNSSELRRFQDIILKQLLEVEKPLETLIKIEKGFLSKEATLDKRIYSCFTYLHPDLLKFCNSATSPLIKKYVKEGNKEAIEELLQTDVLISLLNSNNSELRDVLKSDNIPDELVNKLRKIGFETPKQALNHMDEKQRKVMGRNKKVSDQGYISIEKGDMIKGLSSLGIKYIEQILAHGSMCKEFLGDAASTDSTPLDTDISIIDEQGLEKTYSYGSWGPIYILLKKDDRFCSYEEYKNNPEQIPEDVIEANKGKLEICNNGNNIGGIRTSFSSSDINAFLIEDGKYDKRLELEIAKSGLYIPIVDSKGKVLFTYKQYESLREKMNGLSQYGMGDKYIFSDLLVNDDVIEMESHLNDVKKNNNEIKTKIYDKIQIAIDKFNEENGLKGTDDEISLKNRIGKEIIDNELEVLSTGSSDRNTNVPDGKLDFDFIVRLDNKFLKSKKGKKSKEKLIKSICEELHIPYKDGDIKDVPIKLGKQEIKVDFTFLGKTNNIEYSTEMCINDRLETIKRIDPNKYRMVVANIMLAKKVLGDTSVSAYSKKDGGLGGVGIENWILQNGGSFYTASKRFLEIAKECNGEYDDFKKQFSIWDFGKNHYAYEDGKSKFPHDDFVYSNLKKTAFEKMVKCLEEYIKSHPFRKFEESDRKTSSGSVLSFDDITLIARDFKVVDEIGTGRPANIIQDLEKEAKEDKKK